VVYPQGGGFDFEINTKFIHTENHSPTLFLFHLFVQHQEEIAKRYKFLG